MSRLKKLRKAATRFLEKLWAVVPVPPNTKGPKIKGWQKLRITKSKVDDYFADEDGNIGILLGEPSGGLTDTDLAAPKPSRWPMSFSRIPDAFTDASQSPDHTAGMCPIRSLPPRNSVT